jgi:hypothetical protein
MNQSCSFCTRACSCASLAWATGGPPQTRRSSLWTTPCGVPVREAQAETFLDRVERRSLSLRWSGTPGCSCAGADAERRRACCDWRSRSSADTWSASSSPGMPRKSASSSEPTATPPPKAPPSKSTPWKDASEPMASNLPWASTEDALSSRLASSRRSSSQPSSRGSAGSPGSSAAGLSRAWSRSASISLASCISAGTDGRNTEAVSPRLRARTKRPTAWAKNSGVDVDVA